MKRLNLAHKPMIIGLKANVAEIAATYQAAYPNAVSYTHLDVYKRQPVSWARQRERKDISREAATP